MDWFIEPILIAPWIIYLMAAGCASFGFVLAAVVIAGKQADQRDHDQFGDQP